MYKCIRQYTISSWWCQRLLPKGKMDCESERPPIQKPSIGWSSRVCNQLMAKKNNIRPIPLLDSWTVQLHSPSGQGRFESFVYRHKACISSNKKRFFCQRMCDTIMTKTLLTFAETPRVLHNLLSSSLATLDSATIHDLLNFYSIATDRMLTCVSNYILAPPGQEET